MILRKGLIYRTFRKKKEKKYFRFLKVDIRTNVPPIIRRRQYQFPTWTTNGKYPFKIDRFLEIETLALTLSKFYVPVT